MSDEKPAITKEELLKMPLPKLRELGLKLEGLPTDKSVHGMTKDELIRAIASVYKINLEDRPELKVDKRAIKAKIAKLREAQAKARASGDKRMLKILRKRIKRLKRKIRWH